jgi:CRISPR-associated protein Cas2
MRRCYIVAYDICDEEDKPRSQRLREVEKTMEAYGERIQYSVFRCELTPMKRATLEGILEEIIHHDKDQILFIDLGPVPGRGERCIRSLGKPYAPPERGSIVL